MPTKVVNSKKVDYTAILIQAGQIARTLTSRKGLITNPVTQLWANDDLAHDTTATFQGMGKIILPSGFTLAHGEHGARDYQAALQGGFTPAVAREKLMVVSTFLSALVIGGRADSAINVYRAAILSKLPLPDTLVKWVFGGGRKKGEFQTFSGLYISLMVKAFSARLSEITTSDLRGSAYNPASHDFLKAGSGGVKIEEIGAMNAGCAILFFFLILTLLFFVLPLVGINILVDFQEALKALTQAFTLP